MNTLQKLFLKNLKSWHRETIGMGYWHTKHPLTECSQYYLDDKEFIKAAIKITPWSYLFASKRLRNDLSITKLAIITEPLIGMQLINGTHTGKPVFPKNFLKNKEFLDWLRKNKIFSKKYLKEYYEKLK